MEKTKRACCVVEEREGNGSVRYEEGRGQGMAQTLSTRQKEPGGRELPYNGPALRFSASLLDLRGAFRVKPRLVRCARSICALTQPISSPLSVAVQASQLDDLTSRLTASLFEAQAVSDEQRIFSPKPRLRSLIQAPKWSTFGLNKLRFEEACLARARSLLHRRRCPTASAQCGACEARASDGG